MTPSSGRRAASTCCGPAPGRGEPARLGEITEAQFESLIPCGEAGRPDEIATAALFPASGDSGCGNGMELVAGGGTTAI